MAIKLKPTLLLITILAIFLISSTNVLASPLIGDDTKQDLEKQDLAFLEESGLQKVSIGTLIAAVIKIVLSVLGIVFIILIIYAGLSWMTSAGSEEKITKAKKTMAAAVIGLTIVLLAYAITAFVLEKILEGMSMGSSSGGSGGFSAS